MATLTVSGKASDGFSFTVLFNTVNNQLTISAAQSDKSRGLGQGSLHLLLTNATYLVLDWPTLVAATTTVQTALLHTGGTGLTLFETWKPT